MSESALYPGWETVRKIGSGSFGAVYEITRTLPNGKTEKAALKVISIPQNEGDVEELYSSGYDDASITAHFKSYLADIVNEYSLMAEIKGHTNVVYCDDIRYIQHDDGFGWDIFIKMELLTPLMKAKELGAVEDTVKKLGADICSALVLCREKNIIHRDIKPQNIFVSEHGDYKLGDFGIAKTVEKATGGTKIGTYGYMAPEVYNNQPYGAAADIYSLGLVMYWLLNEHRLPFLPMPPKVPTSTENEQARLRRFRGEPLPAPKNGSSELKRIVLKACTYDPKERYHTADEMLADLNALEGGRTITKTNDSCCWDEDNATEITDETCAETVGAFGTDRKKAAAVSNHSCKIEDDALNTSTDETAQTVGINWKDEKKESRGMEKPSKKGKHKVLPVAAIAILICVVGGIYGYTHCWFGHVWGAADCTVPATCTRCGATNGSALGHNWNAATCTAPETCSRCGVTSGAALGHSWNAATYDAPKTCSVCGVTTGATLELPIFGLDMTLEIFEKQSFSLLEQAKSWTYGNSPQDLSNFPIFPKSLSEMVEIIKEANSGMRISDSTITWESNLPDLLSASKTGFEWIEMYFDYIDLSKNAWQHIKFDSGKSNQYTTQIPENAWTYGSSPKLSFSGHRRWEKWQETLQVSYEIQNERVNGVSFIALIMSNHEYNISWNYYFDGSNKLNIDIYSNSSGRIWYLTYDMTSGRLLGMSK